MDTRQQYARYVLPVVAKGVEPVVVASASGRTITDVDGTEYLDCFSGISVVNAGHNHPRILEAARQQMEKLVHCCSYVYHVPVVGELAEKLAQVTPGDLSHSFFSNSGAEAIEGAMRLAKQATGRRELVALGYSFHGRTIGTLSITGNMTRKRNNGPYLSGVAFGPAPYCYRCPLGLKYPSCDIACAHALTDVIRQQTSGDVAAFIVEPVLGEGGIVTPPAEYLSIAARIFHDNGSLLILDEVQTGFGRTGKMFGCEHSADVAPDVLTMAKGIAGVSPGRFHGKSCDRGRHEARRPPVHVRRQSDLLCRRPGQHRCHRGRRPRRQCGPSRQELMARFTQMQEHCHLLGDVRGRGLMIGLELVRDRVTKEPAPCWRRRPCVPRCENGAFSWASAACWAMWYACSRRCRSRRKNAPARPTRSNGCCGSRLPRLFPGVPV